MNIIARITGWFEMVLKNRVREEYEIDSITSSEMDNVIEKCFAIYQGHPYWLDAENHIKTINFAKAVSSETARLTMLGTRITIDGSARATWLQEQIDKIYYEIRHWIEYGCAYGTIILKPSADGVDMVTPEDFVVTESADGKVTGVVFVDRAVEGKKYYTRMEYHRYVGDTYVISNKCFVGNSETDDGKPVDIANTPWHDMMEEAAIDNVDRPLYGVFRTPHANNIDIYSPLGLPIYSDAIEELKDLDIAYSRNSKEIFDSKRTVLLDSDKLLPSGGKVANTAAGFERTKESMGLPDYVKNVYGNGQDDFYQEINPQLNTDTRLNGINALLSQIGYKVGFSNGYFVFNESGGIQTATQVESDDRRTIQLIKDVRDKLEACLGDLINALSAYASLYGLAPVGNYEVTYDFGDITYNREEDRQRWWGYVVAGKVPMERYLEKFEGMSKEEAAEIVKAAQPKEPKLFEEE